MGGVVVLFLYWNGRGETNQETQTSVDPKTASVNIQKVIKEVQYEDLKPETPLRFTAPPGRMMEHDFHIRHDITMRMPKNPMDASHGEVDPQQMKLAIRGTLISAAYTTPLSDRLLIGYRVSSIEMDSGEPSTSRQKELLQESMNHEVLAHLTPRGRFERLYFSPQMIPQARNLAREIILRTQVILPETPVSKWKSMEEDVTGLFEAEYQGRWGTLEGKKILEVVRTKISYLAINSDRASSASEIPTVPTGTTTGIIMLEEGWLRDLSTSEGLKAGGDSFLARIQRNTEAGLLFRKIWQDAERAKLGSKEMEERLSQMEGVSPIGLENAEADAEARRVDRLESMVGGRTFEQVFHEVLLPLLSSGKLLEREGTQARRLLAAIFELDPAQVGEALALMRSGAIPAEIMSQISTALGLAGTPPAQSALVELVTDEQMDPQVRISSLLAMATPQHPTLEAQEALQVLVDPTDPRGLGVNTLLILGAMSGKLNQYGGEGSDSGLAFLLQQEDSFRDAGKANVFLNAIGNSQDDRAFDVVCRYLEDSTARIRACAVEALSGMGNEGVSRILVNALQDKQTGVQVRAIGALKKRVYTSDIGGSVRNLLISSPSVRVRKSALRYFQKYAAKNPGAMEVIRSTASQDPDESVRKMAQEMTK